MAVNISEYDLKWTAAGGVLVTNQVNDDSDLDAALCYAMVGRIRDAAYAGVAAILSINSDPELSTEGKARRREAELSAVLGNVNALASVEAPRKALKARMAAAPIPGLDSIPAPIVTAIIAAMQSCDVLERFQKAKAWLDAGDAAAAVVLINLPSPVALISAKEAAELREMLRSFGDAPAAARARDLQNAIGAVDAAQKAAEALLRDAAGVKAPQGFKAL